LYAWDSDPDGDRDGDEDGDEADIADAREGSSADTSAPGAVGAGRSDGSDASGVGAGVGSTVVWSTSRSAAFAPCNLSSTCGDDSGLDSSGHPLPDDGTHCQFCHNCPDLGNPKFRKAACATVQFLRAFKLPFTVQVGTADEMRAKRWEQYDIFAKAVQGARGKGDRKRIPVCAKRAIRHIFPDPTALYTGHTDIPDAA